MPLLRDLGVKIRTKFSPATSPAASPSASPTSVPSSFEVASREAACRGAEAEAEAEAAKVQMCRGMDSFLGGKDGVSVPASVVLRDTVGAMEEKKAKRRSRFREEFGDEV